MINYKKLGYIALNVSDIEKSKHFYQNVVGLQLVEQTKEGIAFFRCSQDHHNIVLYPSTDEEAGIKRVAFQLAGDNELDPTYNYLVEQGLEPEEISKGEQIFLKQGRSFRIVEPNTGLIIEFYSKVMHMARKYEPTVTKIQRLGHIVLNVSDFNSALNFFTEVLNFKISDMVGEIAWMRAFPNPLHHSLALSKSNENKLHHINFMVTDIDDIGEAKNRMVNENITTVFGPGRHKPSTSIFFYFLDPDGMTVEYSFGMEEFPKENPRDYRNIEPSAYTMDNWGGKPDPSFASKGKIESGIKNKVNI